LRIRSDIPLGAGFGSSAALSVGIMRALSAFLGHPLDEKDLVSLACQSDQFIHGRLSGIDTTVIALEQAIYYQRGKDIEAIKPLNSLHFVVADSGVYTPTAQSVAYLAERYERDNQATKDKLLAIEEQVINAKQAMRVGDLQMLGDAMNANQTLLYDLGLSCPELDALVDVARDAGVLGAKLSGGGQGGAMLALADESQVPQLRDALQAAGAKAVWTTTLPASQIFPYSPVRKKHDR
ncbi:MAG TPA: mevalonate kinase, partial [Anaerolineaceae bacterium]|nr:mevalonate kinase [Anaerolineaceae bacterium]